MDKSCASCRHYEQPKPGRKVAPRCLMLSSGRGAEGGYGDDYPTKAEAWERTASCCGCSHIDVLTLPDFYCSLWEVASG